MHPYTGRAVASCHPRLEDARNPTDRHDAIAWSDRGVERDIVQRTKPHRLILPLGMRVLVNVIKDDERTDAGLYLPEGAKEAHDEALYGQVIEVARDKPTGNDLGENVSGVPHGAKVLFKKDAGVRVPWDERLRILDVKDILATVEEMSDEEAH